MSLNALNSELGSNQKQIQFVADTIKSKYTPDILKMNPTSPLLGGSVDNSILKNLEYKVKPSNFGGIRSQDYYQTLSSGEQIAKFDGIPKGVTSYPELEEYSANNQSTANKWGNGVTKFLGKTSTAVLGGTLGTVNGVIQGIKDGSFQSTYDNNFNDYLDDLNTKMDYNLPNYYTQQEKELNFGKSLGTANFWANDFLGGLSFTAGAIVSEGIWAYVTGGGSLSTTLARQGTRVGKFFGEGAYLTRALNAASEIAKTPVLRTFATPNLPVALATRLGKAGELLNTARFAYTSAGFESGVEARNYLKEERNSYIDSFKTLNGRDPSVEEATMHEDNLAKSANALYSFNMAIVGSSNLAIFGKTLGIKSPIKAPTRWANKTLFGIGIQKGAEGELEAIAASKLQKIFSKAYALGKAPVVEGLWEEGMQSAGKNTASNWIKSSYDPKYSGNTVDLGTAFTEGIAETYGSKEGWKEIGIGMLIGAGVTVATTKGNVFREVNKLRDANEKEVELRNTYSASKLVDRIHTANRIQSFTEAEEDADKAGDITGAELSRKSAQIAHATHAFNYDYVDQSLAEYKTAIEAMDNQTIMKQYNLETEDEAKEFKKTMYQDFKDVSDSYGKHREFVEQYINPNSKEFESREEAQHMKEAIAYELTLGEHANNFSNDLLQEIKKEVAGNYTQNGQAISNALDVQHILSSATRTVQRDFTAKQKELKAAKRERANLEKERLSLERNKNSQEDNKSTLNRLNQVTVDIQSKDEQTQKLSAELQGVISTAQLQNPYNNDTQPFITETDLENVDISLSQLSDMVEVFKQSSPQRGYKLQNLIAEYGKSKKAFTRYADLSRQLSDPKLGLRGRRNIFAELGKDKNPTEITTEFLQNLRSRMPEVSGEIALETIENNEGVVNGIQKARMTRKDTTPKAKVSTVEDIIKNNPYLVDYIGQGEGISHPTSEEVAEYKELVKRVRRARNINNEAATTINPNYYEKKGITTRLKPTDIERFQELNQKMSDWRLYEGALNDEGISIADLIDQEISMEQVSEELTIKDELTTDDIIAVSTPSEALPSNGNTQFRDASIIQTYENIKVKVVGENFEFSHINLSTLISKMPVFTNLIMKSPTEFDENGYATKWGKPKEIDVLEAIDNQKIPGTEFKFKTEAGEVTVHIVPQAKIQISINSFNAIKESMGLDIFNQLATKNSYSDLYSKNDEGKFVQMESDFDEDNIYTPEELYQLEYNSNTFFKVNINDSYNMQLREDYEAGKITYEALIDLVKVYNVSGNNKVIGDLKSNQNITDADATFLLIRKRAADILLKDQIAEGMITVPYTAKVQHVLLGTPNINMVQTVQGVVPEAIPITEEAVEAITDFGYMENGVLKLRGEAKGVRTDFVDKLGKKANIPVVVFKQGEFLVAYPVSLVKRAGDRGVEVAKILSNRRINNAKKATQINNYLTQNKLNPKDYGLFYISEDNQNMFNGTELSDKLNEALTLLGGIQDFVNVEEWLKPGYNKDNLVNDAQITIDLANRPLRSPKVIVNFNEAASTESPLSWYEEWVNTGAISEEKINEIANKIVAESLTADGLNALTAQENEVVFAETDKINSTIESIYKLTAEKQKQSADEKAKKC